MSRIPLSDGERETAHLLFSQSWKVSAIAAYLERHYQTIYYTLFIRKINPR